MLFLYTYKLPGLILWTPLLFCATRRSWTFQLKKKEDLVGHGKPKLFGYELRKEDK